MDKTLTIKAYNCPRDLSWNQHTNTPEVMQKQIADNVQITWNPDDNRFYVEQRDKEFGDWITKRTNAGSHKGWDNAKYHANQLADIIHRVG